MPVAPGSAPAHPHRPAAVTAACAAGVRRTPNGVFAPDATSGPSVVGMGMWQVGELARATGLTVRTLHHYDGIGLLVPSARNHAGHRRYTDSDVRRLHQIVALRGFGLGLAEIREVLDVSGPDPRDPVRHQL